MCLWCPTKYNRAQRKEDALDLTVQYVGRTKTPKHFSQILGQKDFSGCAGERAPTAACSSSCLGKAVARAVWKAVQAANASSVVAPETQHHTVGGLSGWQHSPPTTVAACLPFGPWRKVQTPNTRLTFQRWIHHLDDL